MSFTPISKDELEVLAQEHNCDVRDICNVCGIKILIQIFRGSGYCCDNHRKILVGNDPSPYPFQGDPTTGAP